MLRNSRNKIIKKTLKIGLPILGTVVALIFCSWLILQSPVVQTYLSQKLAGYFSRKYQTTITVKGVSIAFFNKIVLEGVLIQDQKNDSLLFVDKLSASIDSFSIKKRYAAIGKLELNQTYLNFDTDSAGKANYQFFLDQFKSADTTKTDTIGFQILVDRFDFNDARLNYNFRDSSGDHRMQLSDISLGISNVETSRQKTSLLIDRFQLNNRGEFSLNEFSAQVMATPDSLNITGLHIHTSNSVISRADLRIDKSKIGKGFDFRKLRINLDLEKSQVSLKDIGIFVPSVKGMEENIEVSGHIFGTPVDLKGNNIELSMKGNTRLEFDFYLNGLPDLANTYMHIDLKKSFANFNDLSQLKLPDSFHLKQIVFPEQLLQAGTIEYTGNFTGFLSDFVAFGRFSSKWGVVNTDLSFVPSKGENLKINGKLKTVDFQLGKLLQTDVLGGITFNGNINGLLNQLNNNFSADVVGRIDSVLVNDYRYKNMELTGDIMNKRFDGNLIIDDPNLLMRFDGVFDLNVPLPVFNFNMFVEKADLRAINLVDRFNKSEIAFALNANFTGNNIDNLDGLIHFTEGKYLNENGELAFNNFDLKTFYQNKPVLQVKSDFLDAEIRGQYQLHNLHNSIKQIIAHYLPATGVTAPNEPTLNNFDFKFNLKDINRFTQVLIPSLKINPAEIEGSINSTKNTLTLNATFPEIRYQSAAFRKISIDIEGNSKLNLRNKVEEISIGEKFKVYNLALLSEAVSDGMDSKLSWNNFGAVSYSGSINTSTRFFRQTGSPHVEISVKPTRLFLADSLWQLNSALVTIDSSLIKVNNLKLSSGHQYISAEGSVDRNQENKLNIHFNQIDLKSLNTFLAGNLRLNGELNGSLSVFDLYRKALFLSDLRIDRLSLLGQPLGDAIVQSRWDSSSEEIDAEVLVQEGERNTLHAFGSYNPARDSVSVNANFDHFSILILQPLMGSSFANFHGDATGKVHIYGSPGYIQHDGALYAANAGLMLSELQVNYNLNDSVKFSRDKIIFPNMRITDDFGNSGIFSGSIKHRSFSKMVYDLSVRSDRIMAINTTPAINEQFYGKAFGSGLVRITGMGATVNIDGAFRTEKGTEMNIFLEYAEEAQEYDFLTFVKRGYQPLAKTIKSPVIESNLQMKFMVEITPEAKAQLIYNSKIGDIIRAQGSGNMQVDIDKNFNISLYGEYTVEQGDYLFTLQNVINKRFEIQQGGTIEWNGDPYDATLDLNAIYRLKASLRDLFANAGEIPDTDPNKDFNQRIPVVCKIALSKSLTNPDIEFDIDFSENRIKDQVLQYISSDEDMNKQFLSLLVLGKFYTPEYLRGTYSGSNNSLVGSTASELLSNQFSNWLSQISNSFDIGVNYRPGNQITNDEVELALSTQIFNDRVSINGNIGNNASQRTNANNNGLVGDADVNVKLTRNGKLQLKAYNHANNNLIYETSPYTQGVGLSYREDFNDFNELWNKVKGIFKRKPNKTRVEKKADL